MKRLVCLACSLLLVSMSAAARSGYQEQGQSISAFAQRLSEAFPQISLDDIKLIEGYVMKLHRDGIQPGEATRHGFEAMARGQALLSEDERREMKALSNQMKGTLTGKERERMEVLTAELRQEKSISEADRKFIASMLKESFLRLPAASQGRLRELYGKALRAFLRTVQ